MARRLLVLAALLPGAARSAAPEGALLPGASLEECEDEGLCFLQHRARPEPAPAPRSAKERAAAEAVQDAAEKASKHRGSEEAARAKGKAIDKVADLAPGKRWPVYERVFSERQEERHRNLFLETLLPVGSVLMLAGGALATLRVQARSCGAAQSARSGYLLLTFVVVFNFSIVILDSYDFCSALGMSQATSGRMVGTYMLGACAGASVVWLLQRQNPDLWREWPRLPLAVGLGFQLLGALVYCFVAFRADDSAGKKADLPLSISTVLFGLGDQPWLARLLMFSRLTSGVGSGACQQFFVSSMLHITPVAERTEHTSRWVFAGILALGCGPLAAAAVQALDATGSWPRYDLVGYVQVIGALTALAAVAGLPSLSDVEDCLEARRSNGGGKGTASAAVVCGCLGMTGLRAFSVAAIEVALALSLEDTYRWDQRLTGLVTGSVFLTCVPLKLVHSLWGRAMSVMGWVRLFSALSVVGAVLLYTAACPLLTLGQALGSCSHVLVLAAVVLFPCFYLSDALCSSLMHQHVLPEGSLLDANHTQLWFMLSQGLGRFLGPWLARLTLQRFGQDAFATQQAAVTVLFLISFEVAVRPFISPSVLSLMKKTVEESDAT